MDARELNDQLLKRYLLGELPAAEQRRLEEVFFSDAQAFERLAALEDDLIDDYVCDDLSASQREKFEKHFLVSPERRERLELAQALVTAVSEQPKRIAAAQPAAPWWQAVLDFLLPQNPTIRFALVAASLVILVSYGTKETLENNDLRRQLYQFQQSVESTKQQTEQEISQARAQNEQLQNKLDAVRQQSARREQELTSLLEPSPYVLKSGTRSGGAPGPSLGDLEVMADAQFVKLQLEFDKLNEFKTYRAVLQSDSEGTEIWSQGRLQARATNRAKIVVLLLPAAIFVHAEETEQEYRLTLSGVDDQDEFHAVEVYSFRVVKK
jgi:hypothetical protein